MKLTPMKLILLLLLLVIIVNAENVKFVCPISPENNEVVKRIRPILKWEKYNGAHFYRLQWFEVDPITRSTIKSKYDIVTSQTEYQIRENLVPNRVYYWQLQALDARNNPMTKITIWHFITGNISQEKVEKLRREFFRKVREIGGKLGGVSVHNFGKGVNIMKVQKNSIAEKKGLKERDIIFECNGQPIKTVNDLYVILMQNEIFSIKIERCIKFSKKDSAPVQKIFKI